MRAKLKGLHSPDFNWDSFNPEDPSNFCFLLQAFIGSDNSDAYESFDMHVCTPAWLVQECKKTGIVSGRHTLIIEDYDIRVITQYLEDYCKRISGETWEDIVIRLKDLGSWEFDDYVPYAPHENE